MISTDYNLNNPMSKDLIDLPRLAEYWELPKIEHCTSEVYDLITKDPYKIYIITDKPGLMYYGLCPINNKKGKPKYYVSSEYNEDNHSIEYWIYTNDFNNDHDNLIKIYKFDDPDKAIKTMSVFNKIESNYFKSIDIDEILWRYLNNEISINDFIISCFSVFGYKEHTDIQKAIQMFVSYGGKSDSMDIPVLLRENISRISEASDSQILKRYLAIYNLIVKYNFNKRINDTNISMIQEFIKEIINMFE